jgi:hypothetical protein
MQIEGVTIKLGKIRGATWHFEGPEAFGALHKMAALDCLGCIA